jgi:amino-acid N-acetyltransferase
MTNENGQPLPAPAAASSPPAAQATTIKPTDLRGILQYVPRFQGQIFIIAVDGSIVADENFGNLLVDIAVLRSLAIKVVLVHGIGHQLQELAALRQVPITNADGTGVTDAATLDIAVRASSRVSHAILEGLTQSSLKAVITNAVRAVPVGILKGVDHQYTGKVDRVDKELIAALIERGVVPLVSPIAFGPDGKSLRVNSDLLAAEMAEALHATKIIYLAPFAGLEIDGEVRHEISADGLRALINEHPDRVAESSRSKALYAIRAIDTGTARVHMVDGRVFDGLLNEIFSNEGVGTLVYGNDYQQIRKASRRDARLIYSLTRNAVRREELIHRTLQAIEKNIDQFFVFEIDEAIVACATLVAYPDRPDTVEIGSVYVQPFYHNRGIGKKMVDYACLQAKERGAKTAIALSTQSAGFFIAVCGFEETTKDVLPEARLKAYEANARNARVLFKNLV